MGLKGYVDIDVLHKLLGHLFNQHN